MFLSLLSVAREGGGWVKLGEKEKKNKITEKRKIRELCKIIAGAALSLLDITVELASGSLAFLGS